MKNPATDALTRRLAEQGFAEWAASLPSEPEPLYDEADVKPIRWDPDRGWVEETNG